MTLKDCKKLLQDKLDCLEKVKKEGYYKAKIYFSEIEPILREAIHFLNKLED